ncbi:hypothetical protein D9619_002829 [Psilocybe cf. subviscida]|uniref:F-box domain-containing protein n=1 Tax=Psilocybe cf. subviscida TaxID=2480587 RepID=A0A8H5EU35_9AGAR|nr:hypothetical protein D9619_002829 [Psilocybe cf. subviscida]
MERFTFCRRRTNTASFIHPACFEGSYNPSLAPLASFLPGPLPYRSPPHLVAPISLRWLGYPSQKVAFRVEGQPKGATIVSIRVWVHHESWPKAMDSAPIQYHNTPSSSSELVIRTHHRRMNTGPYGHSGETKTFSGPSYTDTLRLRANRMVPMAGFAATTPLPRLKKPPQFETRAASVKYYHHVSKTIQVDLINSFAICVMSPEEIEEYNLATLRRLERVRILEEAQDCLLPARDIHIEQALFIARLDYRTRMYRTFRMHDLPVEIIQNIFRLVCWSAGDPITNVRWRIHISAVCRLWRDSIISDGTIWSAIWFRDTPDFERSFTWLERAGQTPVDIRINDAVDKPWTMEMTRCVVDKLFMKLPTIRILIVVLHDWDPILYILQALSRVAELGIPMIMERLEVHRSGPAYIQMGDGFTPNYYITPIPLFGGASVASFKYITMNGCHIDWSKSILSHLTTLDIRRIPLERAPTVHEFRAILSGSPQVTKLVLDGAGPKWPPAALTAALLKPILMPELRTLILGDFSLTYGAYLLSQIQCPAVVDLTLMNLIGEDYSPLYAIMTGRMPNVLTLTLYGAETRNIHPVARERIVKWLKSMPKIGFMRIKNVTHEFLNLFCWDGEKLVDTMTTAPGPDEKFEHPVCPLLKTLEIHMAPSDMVKNWGIGRRRQGVPITKIYVGSTSQKPLTREDNQVLDEAVDGPVVVMAYPGKPQEEKDLLGES